MLLSRFLKFGSKNERGVSTVELGLVLLIGSVTAPAMEQIGYLTDIRFYHVGSAFASTPRNCAKDDKERVGYNANGGGTGSNEICES